MVRNLKSNKAAKPEIDAAVKVLLDLKMQFKTVTGQDWKPGMVFPEPAVSEVGPEEAKRKRTSSTSKPGGRRSRTSSKSESVCEPPDWAAIGDAMALNAQIIHQGDKIRYGQCFRQFWHDVADLFLMLGYFKGRSGLLF